MAMAANLREASWITASQLNLSWLAQTLKTKLTQFNNAASAIFDDNTPNDRPVGNWLVLLEATASQMPNVQVPIALFNQACDQVARITFAGFAALQTARIAPAKGTALLAAWNAAFGT